MASVEALLSLPTDEVRSCPSLVTDEDVSVVLREIQTILRKCLYAVRYSLVIPFTVYLRLLLQPTVLESADFVRVLLATTEEGPCINLLADTCRALLARDARAFRREIIMEDFFEFIQQLCATPKLKESLGAVLMPCLLSFFYGIVDEDDDYRQGRVCANVLITLIRASKANKNRMSVECGRIGETLMKSSDIFFQMQCVEIIFRLYTHNRTVLATSTLPEFFKKNIAELPNDASLLTRIQTLLDTYNIDYGTANLLQFTALLIEVGNEEVCGHTDMYFSPLILVIMIPGFSGDNITIPYEHIRSVRLSKERKLGLRLHIVPGRLSHIMRLDEGKDTVMISLTQSTFSAIRSSNIHQWISDRKRRVPISRIHEQMEALTLPAAATTKTTATVVHSRDEPSKGTGSFGKEKNHLTSVSAASHVSAPVSPKLVGSTQQQRVLPTCSLPFSEDKELFIGEPAETGEGDALRQLHVAATQKVARMRQDCQGELQSAVDFMQEELEKMRQINARERDDFEASVREDLTVIRQTEAKVKARAAECVQSLNQELSEIQALSELLKVEVDKLREALSAALQRSESVEEELLAQLKTMVDGEIKFMEETLLNLISSTNPLSFLTTYLSKKLGNGAA